MDKNGDQQPFNISPVTFSEVLDLDFDQGLIYVLEEGPANGPVAIVRVFGQTGKLVQTIQISRKDPDEIPRRMSVFNGQVFVVTINGSGQFTIRQIEK